MSKHILDRPRERVTSTKTEHYMRIDRTTRQSPAVNVFQKRSFATEPSARALHYLLIDRNKNA